MSNLAMLPAAPALTVADLSPAMRAVHAYLMADIPAMIWGAPGVGKSESVAGLAGMLGLPLVDFRLLLRDPVDLRGIPVPDMATRQTIWLRPSDLPFIGNDGPDAALLFMDEINAAPANMQAAAFGLVQERRVGEHTLKSGVRIVAAGNRQSDKAAAQRMPSALLNRFAHVDYHPDVAAWLAWADRAGLAPVVRAFIRFRPTLLHIMPGAKSTDETMPAISADARAFPTPRAWERVARAGIHDASDAIRFLLVAGIVGDGPAAEFEAFARSWKTAPSIASILADPAGAFIPDAPGMLYAVSSALSRAATVATFGAVMIYAQRLPREFETLLALDATRREPGLKNVRAYADWAVRNQDVVL